MKTTPYKLKWEGHWSDKDKATVVRSILRVGKYLSQFTHLSPWNSYQLRFNGLSFRASPTLVTGFNAFVYPKGNVMAVRPSSTRWPDIVSERLITHELFHVLDTRLWDSELRPADLLYEEGIYDEDGNQVTGRKGTLYWRNCGKGEPENGMPDPHSNPEDPELVQMHPIDMDDDGNTATEEFCDMGMMDVFGKLPNNPAGWARHNWLCKYMRRWLGY